VDCSGASTAAAERSTAGSPQAKAPSPPPTTINSKGLSNEALFMSREPRGGLNPAKAKQSSGLFRCEHRGSGAV